MASLVTHLIQPTELRFCRVHSGRHGPSVSRGSPSRVTAGSPLWGTSGSLSPPTVRSGGSAATPHAAFHQHTPAAAGASRRVVPTDPLSADPRRLATRGVALADDRAADVRR